MQQFIQWGGWTPEQLKERQRREWEEAIMIAEAQAAARNAAAAVAVTGGPNATGHLTIVVTADDNSVGLTFSGRIEASATTSVVINWGDGVTETLAIDTDLEYDHTYAENGEYTVTMQFADPSLITYFTSYGDD
jgi:3'-phosphoadenosine 5'-phosphosulfate sulfotransferase (PAPS reductase)/FAD synthetase